MKKLTLLVLVVFCFLACSSNRQESFSIYTTNEDEVVTDNIQMLEDTLAVMSTQKNTEDLVVFLEDNPIDIEFHNENSFIKLNLAENSMYLPENSTENDALFNIVVARGLVLYKMHKDAGVRDSFYQLHETAKLKDIEMFKLCGLNIVYLEINETGKNVSDFICLYHFENKNMALEDYEQKLEKFAKLNDYDIKDLNYIKYWNKKLTNYLQDYTDSETFQKMEQYFKGDKTLTHTYEATFIHQGTHNDAILEGLKQSLYYNQIDKLADAETIYKEAMLEEPWQIDSSKLKHCSQILYR